MSKADGSQVLDLQRDALLGAGIEAGQLYEDLASTDRGPPRAWSAADRTYPAFVEGRASSS